MIEPRKDCADYDTEKRAVKFIDATAPGWNLSSGAGHVKLACAGPAADASFFFGQFPKPRTVRGPHSPPKRAGASPASR